MGVSKIALALLMYYDPSTDRLSTPLWEFPLFLSEVDIYGFG